MLQPMLARLLPRTFKYGVHPPEEKHSTASCAVERMPFVERYVIPLAQHLGAPARPVVAKGAPVRRGEVIAEPGGFVSTTHHSPVTGRVADLGPRRHPNGRLVDCIEIEADLYSSQEPVTAPPRDPAGLDIDEFVAGVQRAGLVGMGGAAFPTHVKYKLPDGKRCEHLVINGCECEPYLTCDHRIMVERPSDLLRGIDIARAQLGAEGAHIGVEMNKPDAIEAIERALDGRGDTAVVPLRVKYPQGAEKMLIESIFQREVPTGKLPIDIGFVVNNVGTMTGIADYFDRGLPLIERIITVSGSGVERPSNLLVPIGTPVRAVLEHCGLRDGVRELIGGGPMMGQPIASLDVPILKGTSGVLAFTEREIDLSREQPCIRCARCLEACPCFLNPSRLQRFSRVDRFEEMIDLNAMDCMECGACSYACPSRIPIAHLIRLGKTRIREMAKR